MFAVAFGPDGQWVVSAGRDGTVLIWEWKRPVHPIVFYSDRLDMNDLSFARDGRHLVIATQTGLVRVLRCDVCGSIEEVVALADKHLTRRLSRQERDHLLRPQEVR